MSNRKSSRPCSIAGCPNTIAGREMCSSHLNKWRRSMGPGFRTPRPSAISRFLASIEVDAAGCWLWTGSLIKGTGYADFKRAHLCRNGHQYAYLTFVGPIPTGLELDHLCRVRRCVNPVHLEPVTRLMNVRRGAATKLSDEQVLEIRRLRKEGVTVASLAAQLGMDRKHISNLSRGLGRSAIRMAHGVRP